MGAASIEPADYRDRAPSFPVEQPPGEGNLKGRRPTTRLRIGIDATCWRLRRGFGRHTRCLMTALLAVDDRNEYIFFVDSAQTAELLREHQTKVVEPSASRRGRSGGRSFFDIAKTSL